MSKHISWLETFNEHLSREYEKIPTRDARFFHIERFSRIAEIVHQHSGSCQTCSGLGHQMLEVSEKLGDMINGTGQDLRQYENLLENSAVHLRKAHGYYPSYYFNYLYTFYGFAAGLAVGISLYVLFPAWNAYQVLLLPPAIGCLAGQLAGRKKDNNLRQQGKKL